MTENLERNEGIIKSHKVKDRQNNDRKKKEKTTNGDLQNTTQKTEDLATRTVALVSYHFKISSHQCGGLVQYRYHHHIRVDLKLK